MNELFLDAFFTEQWRGKDAFTVVDQLSGEVFREVKNRRTLRFECAGESFFLKYHGGVGWREIFKNLFSLKLPVLGAGNEFRAIRKLEQLGIDTMYCAAYGERGANPARRKSFIVTGDLGSIPSLEDICATWQAAPPKPHFKRALISRVAKVSRALAANGMNHRDYYLCHFLLKSGEGEDFTLHLIDLHRMEIRRKIPYRYLIKDLGGLWFSAMDANLSRADVLRFIAVYSGRPLREELTVNGKLWNDVARVGDKLYCKVHNRPPRHSFSS